MTGDRPAGGVSVDGGGAEFALFSANAEAVELCLFDPSGRQETGRLALARDRGDVWRLRVPGVGPGQLYGYRVHGPFRPARGHRFNPNKLLIDPYARRLSGALVWDDATLGFVPDEGDLSFDARDSAPFVPKSVVTASGPLPDTRPRRPWSETLIYEAHVKGLTQLDRAVPPAERGTYAALGHPAVVERLGALGVTALELLPIHAFADDRFLRRRGLTNYWGYSSLGFFAPEGRYGAPEALKRSVAALHAAGIEVILDVVYNHTAELEETGPTLSLRGVDNAVYYKPVPGDPRRSWNITGCGNTLNVAHPAVRRLVLDSLRFWVAEYGIDGFRFDLGTVLAREPLDFNPHAAFFAAIAADPLLSTVKLIAEPWDIGEDGYRLGGFPAGWSEWNDKARDANRRFWRGDRAAVPDLARALAGSREILGGPGRGPSASINYVASHDGFTLRDAVSYEEKHNEANGEGNRDGHNENFTWNCGHEGETGDPRIAALRRRQTRNLLTTLFVSQGVPMLLMGDEGGRSQRGNNNAYCQDNAVTWLDREAGAAFDPDLPGFVAALSRLRRDNPGLRRSGYFTGEPGTGGLKDVIWLAPEGREMAAPDWEDEGRDVLGMQLGNDSEDAPRLLVLFNGSASEVLFHLAPAVGGPWRPVFRSDLPRGCVTSAAVTAERAGTFAIPSRSVVLFHESTPG